MTRIKLACAGILSGSLVLMLSVAAQEEPSAGPVFPFGAVYFRKSNPPEADWARDHQTAAQMGVQHLPSLVYVGIDREFAGPL
jgi:hypothetical protein